MRPMLGVVLPATMWASIAAAQSVDSLTKLLASRDVHVRGDAAARLAMLDTAALPPKTRAAIISLLEHEAVGDVANADTMPLSEDDESWGGEIVDLTDLTIRIGDARGIRGVALLGIQTSRAAQEFIARFGPRSIPALDEAWAKNPDMRHDVDITWGIMMAPGHPAVDSATRRVIAARLLAPADTFPMGLSFAATAGKLYSLVPLLDSLALTLTDSFDVGDLRSASKQLSPVYAQHSRTERIHDLQFWLSAVCTHPQAPLRQYCLAEARQLADAIKQVELRDSAAAANILRSFISETAAEAAHRTIPPLAAMLFVGSARRAIGGR
jgi:hypothetical protein